MSRNQEKAFGVKLADFVRSVEAFADDIEFLRHSHSHTKVKVNVDMFLNMYTHYKGQGDSIKRDLKRCVVPIAVRKLKELENQLKSLELGIGDIHRYMRFKHAVLEGNNGRQPGSPMSSGYGSADTTPRNTRRK